MNIASERLNAYYESLQLETNTNGLAVPLIRNIKEKYFHKMLQKNNPDNQQEKLDFKNNASKLIWVGIESFWKPTGIVFGYPFPHSFLHKIEKLRKSIVNELHLEENEIWFLNLSHLHTTLISYSHYTKHENESKRISFPIDELSHVKAIIGSYNPINIIYRGVLMTNNGSLLLKGFVENDAIFEIRDRLEKKFNEAMSPKIIHIKLGQILTNINPKIIRRFHGSLDNFYIGEINFKYVRFWNGEKINFAHLC